MWEVLRFSSFHSNFLSKQPRFVTLLSFVINKAPFYAEKKHIFSLDWDTQSLYICVCRVGGILALCIIYSMSYVLHFPIRACLCFRCKHFYSERLVKTYLTTLLSQQFCYVLLRVWESFLCNFQPFWFFWNSFSRNDVDSVNQSLNCPGLSATRRNTVLSYWRCVLLTVLVLSVES